MKRICILTALLVLILTLTSCIVAGSFIDKLEQTLREEESQNPTAQPTGNPAAAEPTPAPTPEPTQEPAPEPTQKVVRSYLTIEGAQEYVDLLTEYEMIKNVPLAETTLPLYGGGELNTTDLQGKIVVFNFLATWCSYCVEELPSFAKAMEYYADNENVVFIFVDTLENANSTSIQKKVVNLLTQVGITDPTLTLDANAKFYKNFNKQANSVPCTAFVDTQGTVRIQYDGAFDNHEDIIAMVDLLKNYDDFVY